MHCSDRSCLGRRIWGSPGVGKSQIVAEVARDLEYEFLDVRASQLDPVDCRGILFLDELTSAPQLTQAACYQLVLDRKLGEYSLPPDWVVIAAGNRVADRGVHFPMPRPLRNRFMHLDLDTDVQEWCQWAIRSNIRPEIIAFLRFKPDLLHQPATLDANAWPTPRSWEMASRVLGATGNGNSDLEFELLSGTVGEGAAGELTAFLRLYRELPAIDQIFLHPDRAPVPAEPSAQYAVATAIGRYVTDQSFGRAITYLNRLPVEFKVLAMRDATHRDPSLCQTPEFVAFGVEHSGVIH
jgi:hypothetical protein